jgi:hypothetical protein
MVLLLLDDAGQTKAELQLMGDASSQIDPVNQEKILWRVRVYFEVQPPDPEHASMLLKK